jgi:DNA-binding NarL/FixJ family response regulator
MSESRPAGRPEVVVTSDLALVAETVGASLASCQLDVMTIPWPAGLNEPDEPLAKPVLLGVGPRAGQAVGLLINELDSWPRLRGAQRLIASLPLSWVVLTATPVGPMWGAMLEAGALVVLPSTVDLDAVYQVILSINRGDLQPASEREVLVDLWKDLRERLERTGERMHSLTPREHEVLTMLHAGHPVVRIAQLLEISPATVRSQVKAVRRKLQVKSQLGAVAALDDLLTLLPTALRELRQARDVGGSLNWGMSRTPVRALGSLPG